MTTQNEIKRFDLEVPENTLGLQEIRVFEGTHIQISLNFKIGKKNLIVMGFANPTDPNMPNAENEPPYFLSLARVKRAVDGQWTNVSTARFQHNNARRALNAIFSNAYAAAKDGTNPGYEVPEVGKSENRFLVANDMGIVAVVPHMHFASTGQKKIVGQAWPVTLIFENHLQVEVVLRPTSNRAGYYLDYYRRQRDNTSSRGFKTADNVYWLAYGPEVAAINGQIINLVSGILFDHSGTRPAVRQQPFAEMTGPEATNLPEMPVIPAGKIPEGWEQREFPF